MTGTNPNWHPRLPRLVTAAEWALIEQGKCPRGGPSNWCLQPVDPNSRYAECTAHDQKFRAEAGDDYFAN